MTRTEHLLVILMEECAEVAKTCAKALRFGLDDHAPGSPHTNAEEIDTELAHVLAAAEMLAVAKAIPNGPAEGAIRDKIDKVEQFLIYSRTRGKLND